MPDSFHVQYTRHRKYPMVEVYDSIFQLKWIVLGKQEVVYVSDVYFA